jgi:hypothetical protein
MGPDTVAVSGVSEPDATFAKKVNPGEPGIENVTLDSKKILPTHAALTPHIGPPAEGTGRSMHPRSWPEGQ